MNDIEKRPGPMVVKDCKVIAPEGGYVRVSGISDIRVKNCRIVAGPAIVELAAQAD